MLARRLILWPRGLAGGVMLLALLGASSACSTYRGQTIKTVVGQPYAASDPRFLERLGWLLGTTTLPGNQASELINGDAFMPAMLAAIRGAQRSVTFETYIFWGGDAGRQFTDALAERAAAGVPVRVLLDWIGSRAIDGEDVDRLRAAGAEVRFYNKCHPLNPGRVNHRDHRKLMVVDGRLGFIGGAGVADFWLGNAHSKHHWRDGFYRVEGPVVAQLQSVFMENWARVSGRAEAGDVFFPELGPVGPDPAHIFSNSVASGTDRVRLLYLAAFQGARENIRLSMAYFIPCQPVRQALIDAAQRGVRVEIIVPNARIDSKLVRPAAWRQYGPLLRAGVKIYEYQPTMYHTKTLVVDDAWVSVGSANLDNRSYRYSDEANLNILSADFAAAQVRVFEADKAHSRAITYEQWKRRSPLQRCLECLVWPLTLLL